MRFSEVKLIYFLETHFSYLFLSLFLSLCLLFTACPEPPEDIDCGPHQIEVNRECECEEGYHWNEDNTRCLMDTTSHNFVWEIDTVGTSGLLRDVAIIDENDVWVVGNIESTGGPYNAAYWDGSEWELKRIMFKTYYGSMAFGEIRSIFAISSDDIWVMVYFGSYGHFNGEEWETDYVTGMGASTKAIWGSSSTNIYFVGYNGSIFHYDGGNFERMESDVEIDLLDIWGTSENDIWVAGKEDNESVIIHYDGFSWSQFYERDNSIDIYTIPYSQILLDIVSVWRDTEEDTLIAIGSWGTFHASISNQGYSRWGYQRRWDMPEDVNVGYPFKVRGYSYNDIFVVGQRNSILHFNGKSWHNYLEFYDVEGTWFRSLSLIENVAYIVGDNIVMKAFSKLE